MSDDVLLNKGSKFVGQWRLYIKLRSSLLLRTSPGNSVENKRSSSRKRGLVNLPDCLSIT